jgi:hypothetical protein
VGKVFQVNSIVAVVVLSLFFCGVDQSHAQIPLPVYQTSGPVFVVHRPLFHHRKRALAAVPVQVNYAAFYAPQVPVVPMAYGPVPTMSAYYVPTVPVTQTFFAPVVYANKRKLRRHSVPVAPVAIHPVYWTNY